MTEKPAPPYTDDTPDMPDIPELPELPEEEVAPGGNPYVTHRVIPERFMCVRCGSTNLARGIVVDYSDKFEQVRFAPRKLSLNWLNSIFNLRPWKGLLKLDAVACRDCGAVLLEINPSDLRRAERVRD
ncbi:MAG TPA: hypothetical protein PLD47_10620 [Aggregatilineales bacterium]|nr:hypothetical protein [Anaerolineales bacterium]HRE48168.1 hypothetical protein [Aggregatilineales bacterium]